MSFVLISASASNFFFQLCHSHEKAPNPPLTAHANGPDSVAPPPPGPCVALKGLSADPCGEANNVQHICVLGSSSAAIKKAQTRHHIAGALFVRLTYSGREGRGLFLRDTSSEVSHLFPDLHVTRWPQPPPGHPAEPLRNRGEFMTLIVAVSETRQYFKAQSQMKPLRKLHFLFFSFKLRAGGRSVAF